jgi:hypothetical protein
MVYLLVIFQKGLLDPFKPFIGVREELPYHG